ncbi:MAG: aminoglycoside phosphotransferase family protein [Planctomycetota bacterium]|nr:aminoglycoside phosphotransferase family protein [Planctomycetota bacterium]
MPNQRDQPLHHDELHVDLSLVRRLLAEQCPDLADLELVEVASAGTSNWLFRLGPDLVVRLPRRPSSAAQVAKEHAWLPRLAPGLPLPVPTPRIQGQPCAAFPYPWSVLAWIEGRTPEQPELADSCRIARQLAGFVQALLAQDTVGGPSPGAHNSGRGEPLVRRDQAVRACTQQLAATDAAAFDTSRVLATWERSLAAPQHPGPPRWLHGDLLPSNLLLADDDLAAVIDFGLLGVGDPACDLIPAWALFDAEARAAFRQALQPDEATWTRGRGWAVSFAVIALPYYRPTSHPLADVAALTLKRVLTDGED